MPIYRAFSLQWLDNRYHKSLKGCQVCRKVTAHQVARRMTSVGVLQA